MLQTFEELREFCQNLIDKDIVIPGNLELIAYVSTEEYVRIVEQTGMRDYKHRIADRLGNTITIVLSIID